MPHNLGLGLLLLRHLAVLGGLARGPSLLLVGVDKVSEVIHIPGSFVVLNLASVPEVRESGVSLDLVLLADGLGLGAVKLGDLHCLVLLEFLGELIPGRGQLLTVAAPRSIELDEGVSRSNSFGKTSLRQNVETVLNSGLGRCSLSWLLISDLVTELLIDELLKASNVPLSPVFDPIVLLGSIFEEFESGISSDVL